METRTNRNGHIVNIAIGSELDILQGADKIADRIVHILDIIRPEIRSASYVNGLADDIHAILQGHEDHYEIPSADTIGGIPVTIEN